MAQNVDIYKAIQSTGGPNVTDIHVYILHIWGSFSLRRELIIFPLFNTTHYIKTLLQNMSPCKQIFLFGSYHDKDLHMHGNSRIYDTK